MIAFWGQRRARQQDALHFTRQLQQQSDHLAEQLQTQRESLASEMRQRDDHWQAQQLLTLRSVQRAEARAVYVRTLVHINELSLMAAGAELDASGKLTGSFKARWRAKIDESAAAGAEVPLVANRSVTERIDQFGDVLKALQASDPPSNAGINGLLVYQAALSADIRRHLAEFDQLDGSGS